MREACKYIEEKLVTKVSPVVIVYIFASGLFFLSSIYIMWKLKFIWDMCLCQRGWVSYLSLPRYLTTTIAFL